MTYSGFDQISQLEIGTLNDVLKSGDAQEKVWAAWTLGLRKGGEALPEIRSWSRKAPDSGTRRHLIVILAGFGETELLKVMAQHDPVSMIRAECCKYLLKTAGNGQDPDLHDMLISILNHDDAAEVKLSILNNWNAGWSSLSAETLIVHLADASEFVRRTVIQKLLDQKVAPDRFERAITACLACESKGDLISTLTRWLLAHNRMHAIMEAAAGGEERTQIRILDILVEQHECLRWDMLHRPARDDNPEVDLRLIRLLIKDELPEIMLWMARGIARAIEPPRVHKYRKSVLYQFANLAFPHFMRLVADVQPQKINASDLENLAIIVAFLKKYLISLRQKGNCRCPWDSESLKMSLVDESSVAQPRLWGDMRLDREQKITETESRLRSLESWLSGV